MGRVVESGRVTDARPRWASAVRYIWRGRDQHKPRGTTILSQSPESAAPDRVAVCVEARGQSQCGDCARYDTESGRRGAVARVHLLVRPFFLERTRRSVTDAFDLLATFGCSS